MVRAGAVEPMTPTQRLAEVAEILAAAILRLRRRLSEVPATGEQVQLDYSAGRSMHASPRGRRRDAA